MNIIQKVATITKNPKILSYVSEAWNIAKSTPLTADGIKSTIDKYGGANMLQKGLNALDDNRVQSVLNKFNIDVNGVKSFGNSFYKDNYSNNTHRSSYNNDLKNRLKKL